MDKQVTYSLVIYPATGNAYSILVDLEESEPLSEWIDNNLLNVDYYDYTKVQHRSKGGKP